MQIRTAISDLFIFYQFSSFLLEYKLFRTDIFYFNIIKAGFVLNQLLNIVSNQEEFKNYYKSLLDTNLK